jgi:hypothetical protein
MERIRKGRRGRNLPTLPGCRPQRASDFPQLDWPAICFELRAQHAAGANIAGKFAGFGAERPQIGLRQRQLRAQFRCVGGEISAPEGRVLARRCQSCLHSARARIRPPRTAASLDMHHFQIMQRVSAIWRDSLGKFRHVVNPAVAKAYRKDRHGLEGIARVHGPKCRCAIP